MYTTVINSINVQMFNDYNNKYKLNINYKNVYLMITKVSHNFCLTYLNHFDMSQCVSLYYHSYHNSLFTQPIRWSYRDEQTANSTYLSLSQLPPCSAEYKCLNLRSVTSRTIIHEMGPCYMST